MIGGVVKNYISVLSNTIPPMVSQAAVPGKIAAYMGTVVLYPLAFIVLLGLVVVASVAVFIVCPFVAPAGGDDR